MAGLRTIPYTGRHLLDRAVHLLVYPRPTSIAESREVLRILETFGEVVVYKNLKYEPFRPAPNAAIAIFQDAESARNLLKASPVRFALERFSISNTKGQDEESLRDEADDVEFKVAPGSGRTDAEELIRPSMLLHDAAKGEQWGASGQSPSKMERAQAQAESHTAADISNARTADAHMRERQTISAQEFQLVANVSTMNHRKYIEEQPYYGGFAIGHKSIMSDDLMKSVPLKGLSEVDMQLPGPPLRIVQNNAREVMQRKTLRQVWEEGMDDKTATGLG